VRAYEPSAPRGRSHSAPTPASAAPRRPWSGTHHRSCGRLDIAIAQQEAQPSPLFCSPRSITRLRACWVNHGPSGWRSLRPGDSSVVQFDEEQHVRPPEPRVSTVTKSHGRCRQRTACAMRGPAAAVNFPERPQGRRTSPTVCPSAPFPPAAPTDSPTDVHGNMPCRSERSPVRPAVTSGPIRTDFRLRLLLPCSYRVVRSCCWLLQEVAAMVGAAQHRNRDRVAVHVQTKEDRCLRAAARLGIARLLPCGAPCTAARMAYGTRGTEPVVHKF
jgi:hypothetical protein